MRHTIMALNRSLIAFIPTYFVLNCIMCTKSVHRITKWVYDRGYVLQAKM